MKQSIPEGQSRLARETAKRAASAKEESTPDNALVVWLRLQRSLADRNGVALVTLSQDGAVIVRAVRIRQENLQSDARVA